MVVSTVRRKALAIALSLLALAGCGGGYSIDPLPVYNPPVHLAPGTDPPPQPVTTPYPALPTAAAWPQAGGSQRGDLLSSVQGPLSPQLARQRFAGGIAGPPVHCADGLWRVAAGRTIVAFDDDGALHAILPLDMTGRFSSALAVSPDGNQLYCTTETGLLALGLDGHTLWHSDSGANSFGAPHATQAGLVIVTSGPSTGAPLGFQAFTATGDPAWTFQPAGGIGQVTYGPDDTAYVAGLWGPTGLGTHNLTAVANGAALWARQTTYLAYASPEVGLDGRVYLLTANLPADPSKPYTYIESFSVSGTAAAPLPAPGYFDWGHGTAIGVDGTIFATDVEAGGVQAYTPTGQLKWHSHAVGSAQSIYARPDGTLIVQDMRQSPATIAKLDAGGGLVWQQSIAETLDAPVFLADGALLLSSSDSLTKLTATGGTGFALHMPALPTSLVTGAGGESYAVSGNQLVSFDSSLHQRWRVSSGGTFGQLLLARDGSVVLSGSNGFQVFSAQGQPVRGVGVPNPGGGAQALLGADDTLYLYGLNSQQVAVYSLSGAHRWTYTDEEYLQGGAALDNAGNLYFIAHEFADSAGDRGGLAASPLSPPAAWLVSLDRSGARRFREPLAFPDIQPVYLGYAYVTSPQIGSDGLVYLGFADGTYRRYSADGSGVAATLHPEHGAVLLGPLPGGGALVQLYNEDPATDPLPALGPLAAVDAQGGVVWRYDLGGAGVMSHFTDSAGRTYIATYGPSASGSGPQLLCLGASGALLFARDLAAGQDAYVPGGSQAAPDGQGGVLLTVGDELLRLAD